MLCLRPARQGFVKVHTFRANQTRGLLSEYGIILPQARIHIAALVRHS